MIILKTVGIITFHGAHNYGSVLQAYALQKTINKIGHKCEIINFRTERQKDQYRPLTKRKGVKYVLKNGYFLFNYVSRKKKYDSFENFINKELLKSDAEFCSQNELRDKCPQYDYYISGSDQIWNTEPNDADDSYFLPFVSSGKRIAYAPSFGQLGDIKRKKILKEYLDKYDVLSVREEYGQKIIYELIGKQVPVMPDPTLLVEKEIWSDFSSQRLINYDYIFFYTLFATPEMIKIVKRISKRLNLPVVISNVSNQYEIFSGFKKIKSAGPREFLSLIYHAKFICTSSFHGTAFSIIFEKPFFSINGLKDNRINTLLKNCKLEKQSVSLYNLSYALEHFANPSFDGCVERIGNMKKTGVNFLKCALELDV